MHTVNASAAQPGIAPWWNRLGALSGIAFAIMFVVAVILMGPMIPGGEDANQDITSYYAEADRFQQALVPLYGFPLAGLLYLAFLASLWTRTRRAEDERGALSTIVFGSTIVFVTALFMVGATVAAIAASVELGGESQIQPLVASLGWLAGMLLLIPAMVAAGATISAVSVLGLRTRGLPRWLCYLGLVCAAAIVLLGWAFMPMFALPVWALAAGISLLRAEPLAVAPHQTTVSDAPLGASA
jgi:hypothetical protein